MTKSGVFYLLFLLLYVPHPPTQSVTETLRGCGVANEPSLFRCTASVTQGLPAYTYTEKEVPERKHNQDSGYHPLLPTVLESSSVTQGT